jgi:hypothetical protein
MQVGRRHKTIVCPTKNDSMAREGSKHAVLMPAIFPAHSGCSI